jgi:hypothetical protein
LKFILVIVDLGLHNYVNTISGIKFRLVCLSVTIKHKPSIIDLVYTKHNTSNRISIWKQNLVYKLKTRIRIDM